MEKITFRNVYHRDISPHEFRDLTGADQAVVVEEEMYDPEPLHLPKPQTTDEERLNPWSKPLIYAGLAFISMLDMKIWLQEYAVGHYQP